MEIQLPPSLQEHLITYDSKHKHSTKQALKPSEAPKLLGNKKPLGAIEPLIPLDVVSEEDQKYAIRYINNVGVENRIQYWNDDKGKIKAFIAHVESVWFAWWLPVEPTEYVYGCSFIFKNNSTTLATVTNRNRPNRFYATPAVMSSKSLGEIYIKGDWVTKGFHLKDLEEVQIGRSKYLTKTLLVTESLMKQGFISKGWVPPHGSPMGSGKYDFWTAVFNPITADFSQKYIHWNATSGNTRYTNPFIRLLDNNDSIWYCLNQLRTSFVSTSSKDVFGFGTTTVNVPFDDFRHETDYYLDVLKWSCPFIAFRHIGLLEKPAVRKLLQKCVDETSANFDLSHQDLKAMDPKFVTSPLVRFYHWMDWVEQILNIYPDCPQDHIVNCFEYVQYLKPWVNAVNIETIKWLRDNLPIKSFFKILETYSIQYRQEVSEAVKSGYVRYHYDASRKNYTVLFSDFRDTINMIDTLITNNQEVPKPKRWRISEFHDKMMAETWKIKHTNYVLPQDLFPEPKTLLEGETKFTFFQPVDAHQLAEWGKAVRNCIGNANYASNIKKHQHFIVLIMENHVPHYTAQLKLKDGCLYVSEIKDICNSKIDDLKLLDIQKALGTAISSRSQELNAQSEALQELSTHNNDV